jgi:hypothetical protein
MHSQDGSVAPDKVTAIRLVDGRRGAEWIPGGASLWMKKPDQLMIAGLALFIVNFLLNQIPILIGGLASLLAVLAAGAMTLACRALEEGNGLLAEARKAAGSKPLRKLSLIALGLGSAIAVPGYFLGETVIGALSVGPVLARVLGALPLFLIGAPLAMALWLAPALVVLQGSEPADAMRLSFAAAVKNFLPFLVFYLFAGLAILLGTMLMGLGVIFVYPVLLCATYLAWQDLFS